MPTTIHKTYPFVDGHFSFWAAERPEGTSVFRVRSDRAPRARQDEKGIRGRIRPARASEIACWCLAKDFWFIV